MGFSIDGEAGGIPSINADSEGLDDDGISGFPALGLALTEYSIPLNAITVTNSLNEDATLHAWIDVDNNGSFDSDEYTYIIVPSGLEEENPGTDYCGTWY